MGSCGSVFDCMGTAGVIGNHTAKSCRIFCRRVNGKIKIVRFELAVEISLDNTRLDSDPFLLRVQLYNLVKIFTKIY